MWRSVLAVAVMAFVCLMEAEAGRVNKANRFNKLVVCEDDGVELPCDGPFACETRPLRERNNRRQGRRGSSDQDDDSPANKVCVPPPCVSDSDCEVEGFNTSCLGRPNHKRCIFPRPVHVYFGACLVKTTDDVVVRERDCIGEETSCIGDRPLTYLDQEYVVSKCMPSGDGEEQGGRGGRGRGRGRGGRGGKGGRGGRGRGGRGRGGDDDQNEMEVTDENEEEEEVTGRRGGRRRGGRGRTPKIQ